MEFAPLQRPRRKLKLTSLFFTIGLFLMAVNLFFDVIQFVTFQPHTLGGAVSFLGASILAQLKDAA